MKRPGRENVIGALALALTDAVQREAQRNASEAGPAAAAVALLGHAPGMPIERLRQALGMSHSGAVRLVDRLVEDELVARQSAAQDRRAVALRLTTAGEAMCCDILASRGGVLARALGVLDEEELGAFEALGEKVLRGLLVDANHAYAVCRLCDYRACDACPVDDEFSRRAASAGVG